MAARYKADKYLTELEESGIGDGCFAPEYVKEVDVAANALFNDMIRMCGADDTRNLLPEAFNKPSISKAQLAEWLFSAVYLIDRCSQPLMACASREINDLKSDRIEEQKTMIKLQSEVISKKNEEIDSVKKTVNDELKSYSSVLQNTCSTALAPKNIVSAVKKVNAEEDRSKNLVVFGVTEEDGESVKSKVSDLLEQLDEKPLILDSTRIGQRKAGSTRPIKFRVKSSETAFQLLRKAKRLKDIDGCKAIYIAPDRTLDERICRKKLVCELREKRQSDPSSHYLIRKGEIVKLE